MHSVAPKLAGAAIAAILLISGALISSRNAGAQASQASKDVVVTPLPLPVSITGTPGVNVSSLPAVNLNGNSSTSGVWTRNVNDAVQPVQASLPADMLAGQFFSSGVIYSVPANRRLVMEYASAGCSLPAGQAITVNFVIGLGGSYAYPSLQSSFPAPPGAKTNAAIGQPVRLYADPGTNVGWSLARTDNSGIASCGIQFSGYLTPLP